jgi:hypothetical protein
MGSAPESRLQTGREGWFLGVGVALAHVCAGYLQIDLLAWMAGLTLSSWNHLRSRNSNFGGVTHRVHAVWWGYTPGTRSRHAAQDLRTAFSFVNAKS